MQKGLFRELNQESEETENCIKQALERQDYGPTVIPQWLCISQLPEKKIMQKGLFRELNQE